MDTGSTEIKSIDSAIDACRTMEEKHISSASRILSIVLMLTITLITILAIVFLFPFLPYFSREAVEISDNVLYVFLAIYTLTFSILIATYRLHIGESARLQHHKIGFMRIRVAGNNNDLEGYQTEVREALTRNAFEYQVLNKSKDKIEPPIPGHPAGEITTTILNKVLDGIDIVTKKDKKAIKNN